MAGLREQQKADRELRILRAAVTLFKAEGYRAARIEDLAEIAEVSVGTVYNYYRTKGDILISIVAMEVEEVLETGAELAADPPPGLETALRTLILHYCEHSLSYLSKEMWRMAMAISIEASETPNGRRYNALDRKLARQVTDLIATLQRRGEARSDVDPEPIGRLVFNDLNMMFIDFVKDESMSFDALRTEIAAHTRPLARMLAPEAAR